jgi:hypothetical protein
MLILTLMLCFSCSVESDDWPDRRNRTPQQMLEDLIRWQQSKNVRTSTGTLDFQCFTDRDLRVFQAEGRPAKIVARIESMKEFAFVVDELRTLSQATLMAELRSARLIARPTWETMGFIDKEGRGQTDAGHEADLEIAVAITMAFAARLGII